MLKEPELIQEFLPGKLTSVKQLGEKMGLNTKIHLQQEKIEDFCKRYHVRKLSFFGSALSKDFRPDSDIDTLIEFEAGKGAGFIGMAHMQGELSEILGGRQVDLRTPGELSRYFREDVVSNALVQYAKS